MGDMPRWALQWRVVYGTTPTKKADKDLSVSIASKSQDCVILSIKGRYLIDNCRGILGLGMRALVWMHKPASARQC